VLNRTYPEQRCSIARALEIVGERWTLLILRDILEGKHRFEDLQASLTITRSVLSTRLAWLVREGLLERHRYQTNPERFEYHPTAKARDLWPVLLHLMLWGDAHYRPADGPPRTLEHKDCGGRINRDLICHRCGRTLVANEVRVTPRPATNPPTKPRHEMKRP
jgi:DNA-binding HxlR family transcriptional regulator